MISKRKVLLAVNCAAIIGLLAGCATTGPGNMPAEDHAAVNQLVKTTQSWDGATLPHYPQGQPEITILDITIPPGVRLATHSHPVINAGVMLSGQLTVVTTNGQTLHLEAGDPIVEVVNTLHYGVNEGSVPARLIVFYAGIVDMPITLVEENKP